MGTQQEFIPSNALKDERTKNGVIMPRAHIDAMGYALYKNGTLNYLTYIVIIMNLCSFPLN